jgi:hypothetical protein
VEFRLDSGRVLDVGLLDAEGRIRMGVEVYVSHLVDEIKAGDLGDLAWIEVDAAEVEDPAIWPARRVGGHVGQPQCQECPRRRKARQERRETLLKQAGLPDPGPAYLVVPTSCWKCGRTTPVFFWENMETERPPKPVPKTVKERFSQTRSRSYLANGCVHCNSLIGQFYLSGILIQAEADLEDLSAAVQTHLGW